jgi:quercetin dioxygenase-like cupin family protein
MPPKKFSAGPLARRGERPRSHALVPPAAPGVPQQVAIMEWELRGESWTDEHPHDEFNYVLEGRLFVECDGTTEEAGTGDVVQVPAGSVGRYWAPDHARMVAVYGPNPEALPTVAHGLRRLPPSR